jgi:hypothetical protein
VVVERQRSRPAGTQEVGDRIPVCGGSVGAASRIAHVRRHGQVGDADRAPAGVAVRTSVGLQLVDERRCVDARLLEKLTAGRILEILVDPDEPARERELALLRLTTPLDEQDLEVTVTDGQADDVHGDGEDRVLAGVDHAHTLLVVLTISNLRR